MTPPIRTLALAALVLASAACAVSPQGVTTLPVQGDGAGPSSITGADRDTLGGAAIQ